MTDKFNPGSGGGGGVPVTPPGNNSAGLGVSIKDSTGRLTNTIQLDQNGRGTYSKTINENDLGVRTMNSSFTGKPGLKGEFTQHVLDQNGVLQGSLAGTVSQIVAGDGIYISAPNGQGVVTISTSPVELQPTTIDFRNIAWTKRVGNLSTKYPSQFIAIGDGGLNMRSRDGNNWVRLPGQSNISISEIVSVANDSVLDDKVEYWGYCSVAGTDNLRNRLVYGRLGNTSTNTDGMASYTTNAITDQNGAITQNLIALNAFVSSGDVIQYFTGGLEGGIWVGKPTLTNPVLTFEATPLDSTGAFASDATTASSSYIVIGVGQGSSGDIARSVRTGSSSGTWTASHTNPVGVYFGVAYGNGRWVAVGSNNSVSVSTNSTTWTDYVGTNGGAAWRDVAYGNGNFVACGDYTVDGIARGCVMFSTDGINWTKGNSGTSKTLDKIEYSSELNSFVAVGANGAIVTVKG